MKGVERMNAVVVRNPLQEQEERGGGIKRNSYAMEVDRRRNCYSCGEFGYLACNCRNWKIVSQGRRIEYRKNLNITNNLKEKENLVVLN